MGILQGDRDVCVIPAGEGEAFCDVTVRKQRAAQSSDTAVSLIGSYMQGTADRIVDGQLYYILALLKTAGILTAATVIPAVLLIMVKERRLTGAAVLFAGVFIPDGRRATFCRLHSAAEERMPQWRRTVLPREMISRHRPLRKSGTE